MVFREMREKIRIRGEEKRVEEEILEKAKPLKVFWQKEEGEISIDSKKNLEEFLREEQLEPEFLKEVFKRIKKINQIFSNRGGVIFPEKIRFFSNPVSFKKGEVYPKDLTQMNIDFKEKVSEFSINLKDPRFKALEESKFQIIEGIYLMALSVGMEGENLPENQKIIEESKIIQKIKEAFFSEEKLKFLERKGVKKEKIEGILKDLKTDILINSLQVNAFFDILALPEYLPGSVELLKSSTKVNRDQVRKSVGNIFYLLPNLNDLALNFELARILKNLPLQEKTKETVNKLKWKETKEIFNEFRKVYYEISEKCCLEELEKIEERIFVPELPIEEHPRAKEYYKRVLEKIAKKLKDEKLKGEIERIQTEKEVRKILKEMVERGIKLENLKEAEKEAEKEILKPS